MTETRKEYRVRVETPDRGWEWMIPWLGEWNARRCYDRWCANSGKTVLDVQLWAKDAQGERLASHCSLRTDLRAAVKAALVAETEQMALFGFEQEVGA